MRDCIIIGAGLAGLSAAIQLGRYERDILVIDSGQGRSSLCQSYHNIIGWPKGVSGPELRAIGRKQAESTGVQFIEDEVIDVNKLDQGGFEVICKKGLDTFQAHTLLFATGLSDRFPPLPGLIPCLGLTMYVCPDCDGYEIRNRKTIILGSGNAGAHMAMILRNRTDDLTFINHEDEQVDEERMEKLLAAGIQYIAKPAAEVVVSKPGKIRGVYLEDGTVVAAERGFLAFGGNKVHSDLPAKLGVERLENRHILTDPRSRMTSVKNVWSAGDVNAHSEQAIIAMGEGNQCAIWINKALIGMGL